MRDLTVSIAACVRLQVIRMLLAIIGVFFCCWGPKCVLNVLKRHELDVLHTNHAFYTMVSATNHLTATSTAYGLSQPYLRTINSLTQQGLTCKLS